MRRRSFLRLKASTGVTIAVEVDEAYAFSTGAIKEARIEVVTAIVSSLANELRPVLSATGAKSLKVECALDFERDGDDLTIFVTRNPTNAAFKVAIELSGESAANPGATS